MKQKKKASAYLRPKKFVLVVRKTENPRSFPLLPSSPPPPGSFLGSFLGRLPPSLLGSRPTRARGSRQRQGKAEAGGRGRGLVSMEN